MTTECGNYVEFWGRRLFCTLEHVVGRPTRWHTHEFRGTFGISWNENDDYAGFQEPDTPEKVLADIARWTRRASSERYCVVCEQNNIDSVGHLEWCFAPRVEALVGEEE